MKRKPIITFLRFAIPLAIIAFLLFDVDREQVRRLWERPKNWSLLAAGFGLVMAAVLMTFVRWYALVRALGLPFRIADALRLSFLGYLFNFIGAGSVGGDLFKAVFIAREQPGRRTEAVATVVLDRVIGMYLLFVVASLGILVSDISHTTAVVRAMCQLTLWLTVMGTVVILVLLLPRFGRGVLPKRVRQLPAVGPVLARTVGALQVYRQKLGVLALVAAMSLSVHAMFSVALYLVGAALYDQPPTLGQHFIIVPLAMCAGGLPITPAGLGTFEVAMEQLYTLVSTTTDADGLMVALAYRLMTIVITAIGVVYYWTSRREVRSVLQQAAEEQQVTEQCAEGCA